MIALLHVELRKLGGSLALLLAVAAPALPGVLAALALVSARKPPSWASILTEFVLPLWTLFLMPMVVAAFTALVAQIEHRSRGWDHVLALPIPRPQIFAAKAIVVLATTVAMTLLVLLFTWIGASVGGAISGHPPLGAIPWARLARLVPMLLSASLALVVIQLWVALRFASFVVPLATGIGGTLVALAVGMTRTTQADWFPWVLPMKVMTAPDPMVFAAAGGVGGLALLALMIVDLSRRSFA
jgi:ABC-2 type transport system permease protein